MRLKGIDSYNYYNPNILALRHGQDKKVLDGSFDMPLTDEGVSDVLHLATNIAESFYNQQSLRSIKLYHGNKLRTLQTASLIAERVSGGGISVATVRAKEIDEMNQGEIVLDKPYIGDEQYLPLRSAWIAFQDAIAIGDLNYKFGDPNIDNGNPKYPDLVGHFTRYGENQLEFTWRVYQFIRHLVNHQESNVLPVIVTHQGIVSRFQRIFNAANSINDIDNIEPGSFIRHIEPSAQRISVERGEGVFIPLGNKEKVDQIIFNELEFIINYARNTI